ncbi:MAG: nickel-dependent hydrogenase large subunit [Promethearchaeota archaeon]
MKRIIIKPLTRVEGQCIIEIFADKKGSTKVRFSTLDFRGIEKVLIGKKFKDIPRLVPKICGVCAAAHTVASCQAIEKIFDIYPTNTAIQLRQLLMIGETIKSHALHFFFLALPDLLKPFENKNINDISRKMTLNAFKLIEIGKKVIETIGGRSVHPVTCVVGGMSKSLTEKDRVILQKIMKRGLPIVNWSLNELKRLFKSAESLSIYELSNPIFMGLQKDGAFNLNEGEIKVADKKKRTLATFDAMNYDKFVEIINLESIKRSSLESVNLIVGPIARTHAISEYGAYEVHEILNNFRGWENNLLFSNILRLIEILACIFRGLLLLDSQETTEVQPLPIINKIEREEGVSAVEAPRGTLLHYYHVNKDFIVDEVKIHTPSEINTPSIQASLNRICKDGFDEKRLELIKERSGLIVRSFDPCIPCVAL